MSLLLALAIAAILTAVFALALGWRRPGDLPRGDQRGALEALFFAAVALVTWLGGGWLTAHDPAWAPRWITFLLAGLLAALVVVALVASEQRWRTGAPAGHSGGAVALGGEPARVAPGLAALFWGLLAGVIALSGLLWRIQPPG